MIRLRHLAALFAALMLEAAPAFCSDAGWAAGWTSWGGDPGGQKFSPLKEITPENVGNLVRAFEYHTGDLTTRPPEVILVGHALAGQTREPCLRIGRQGYPSGIEAQLCGGGQLVDVLAARPRGAHE